MYRNSAKFEIAASAFRTYALNVFQEQFVVPELKVDFFTKYGDKILIDYFVSLDEVEWSLRRFDLTSMFNTASRQGKLGSFEVDTSLTYFSLLSQEQGLAVLDLVDFEASNVNESEVISSDLGASAIAVALVVVVIFLIGFACWMRSVSLHTRCTHFVSNLASDNNSVTEIGTPGIATKLRVDFDVERPDSSHRQFNAETFDSSSLSSRETVFHEDGKACMNGNCNCQDGLSSREVRFRRIKGDTLARERLEAKERKKKAQEGKRKSENISMKTTKTEAETEGKHLVMLHYTNEAFEPNVSEHDGKDES